MNPRLTLATGMRVLRQTAHDRRTVAILLVAPVLALTIIHYMFEGKEPMVSRLELQLLIIFPLFIMFLLTAIATVRERTSGTLERLMTTPIGKGDIIAGYALAYGLMGAIQATITSALCWWVLDMNVPAPFGLVLVSAVLAALLGLMFGLLASAMSQTEFQAVQFMPLIVVPQILLCGLLTPREEMADWLRYVSAVLPLSYTMDGVRELFTADHATSGWWFGMGITFGVIVLLLTLAAATLRRRTP